MKRVKRGRDRVVSRGPRDGLNRESQMSMDRRDTRNAYVAREIVSKPHTFEERKDANKAALDQVQSKMKPIRSRQK